MGSHYADREMSVLTVCGLEFVYSDGVTVLLWWLIPLLATVVAIALLSLSEKRRTREPDQKHRDADLRRMARVLERPMSPPGQSE